MSEEQKVPRKNYNKHIKILALIAMIPITALGLDVVFNSPVPEPQPQPQVTETRYFLTENCFTDIMLKTESAEVVQLKLDCLKDATVEELRDALGLLREKADELNYAISFPFSADSLYESIMKKYEVDDSI